MFILKTTPTAIWVSNHLLTNWQLIGCSICLGQLFSPVRALLNQLCGLFSCGNMGITGFSNPWWYGFSEGNRPSTSAKLETEPSIITPSAVVPQNVTLVAIRGRWRSERGGVGESWLWNNFFSIYYSTFLVSGDGIAVAICESWKIVLKSCMTQYISSHCCHARERLLKRAWAVTAGLWSVGLLLM